MFRKEIKIDRLGFGNKIGEKVSNASFIGSFLLLGAGIVIKELTTWMFDPEDYVKIINDSEKKKQTDAKDPCSEEDSEQA